MQVTLIAAQSLDGFIARHDVPGTQFTSAADREWFPSCLRAFDVCVMGGATWREAREAIQIQPDYAGRRRIVCTRDPARYAVDARPGALEFTAEPASALVARLAREGHRHCALLGGGELNGLWLAAGLVHEFWITLEPRVFGEGRPLAAGRHDVTLRLREHRTLGPDTLLLRYEVQR
jgi:dihydrofolate reductase